MSLKPRGIAVFLVALLAVATCGVLFATPGFAATEACGQTHVWEPAKPTTENPAAIVANAAVASQLLGMIRPDVQTWIRVPESCEGRPGEAFADPPAPRAPPLA